MGLLAGGLNCVEFGVDLGLELLEEYGHGLHAGGVGVPDGDVEDAAVGSADHGEGGGVGVSDLGPFGGSELVVGEEAAGDGGWAGGGGFENVDGVEVGDLGGEGEVLGDGGGAADAGGDAESGEGPVLVNAAAALEHVSDGGGGEGWDQRPPGMRPERGDDEEQGRSVADEGPVAGVGGYAAKQRGERAEQRSGNSPEERCERDDVEQGAQLRPVGQLLEDAKERHGEGAGGVAEADEPDESEREAEGGMAQRAGVAEEGKHGDEGDHGKKDGQEDPDAALGGEVEQSEGDDEGGEECVPGVLEEAVLGEADVVPEGLEGVEERGGVCLAAEGMEDADESDDGAVGDDVEGHEEGCEEQPADDAVAGGVDDAVEGGVGVGADRAAEPDGEQRADDDPHAAGGEQGPVGGGVLRTEELGAGGAEVGEGKIGGGVEADDEELEEERDDEGADGAEDGMGGVFDLAFADDLADPLDEVGDDGGDEEGEPEAESGVGAGVGIGHLEVGEIDGVSAEHAERAAEGRRRRGTLDAEFMGAPRSGSCGCVARCSSRVMRLSVGDE